MARLSNNYQAVLRSLVESESMASVSNGAELLFFKLLLASDAGGRFYGSALQVVGRLMGTKADRGLVSIENAKSWLDELVAANLVSMYEAEGQFLLEITDYYDPQKDAERKYRFPGPAEGRQKTATGGRNGMIPDRGMSAPPVGAEKSPTGGDSIPAQGLKIPSLTNNHRPTTTDQHPTGGVGVSCPGPGLPQPLKHSPPGIQTSYKAWAGVIEGLLDRSLISIGASRVLLDVLELRCVSVQSARAMKTPLVEGGWLDLGREVDKDLELARRAFKAMRSGNVQKFETSLKMQREEAAEAAEKAAKAQSQTKRGSLDSTRIALQMSEARQAMRTQNATNALPKPS